MLVGELEKAGIYFCYLAMYSAHVATETSSVWTRQLKHVNEIGWLPMMLGRFSPRHCLLWPPFPSCQQFEAVVMVLTSMTFSFPPVLFVRLCCCSWIRVMFGACQLLCFSSPLIQNQWVSGSDLTLLTWKYSPVNIALPLLPPSVGVDPAWTWELGDFRLYSIFCVLLHKVQCACHTEVWKCKLVR